METEAKARHFIDVGYPIRNPQILLGSYCDRVAHGGVRRVISPTIPTYNTHKWYHQTNRKEKTIGLRKIRISIRLAAIPQLRAEGLPFHSLAGN
jgi:hypothetical protein